MKHKLTIDFEEWFHSYIYSELLPVNKWDKSISRIQLQTELLLNALNIKNIKATFFIVGWVADKFPSLIEKLAVEGHQIGIHTYWHKPLFLSNSQEFAQDIDQCITAINKAVGLEPKFFRAPNFSIRKDTLWCLPILQNAGIEYDSSVHISSYHPDYNDRFQFNLDEFSKFGISEFPLKTLTILNKSIPFAGGAYFRFYPYSITKRIFKYFEKRNEQILFYIHPWELDSNLPKLGLSILQSIRTRYNTENNYMKFNQLINDFEFEPLK